MLSSEKKHPFTGLFKIPKLQQQKLHDIGCRFKNSICRIHSLTFQDIVSENHPFFPHSPEEVEKQQRLLDLTIGAILPRVADFTRLLLRPPDKGILRSSAGALDPPLGITRLSEFPPSFNFQKKGHTFPPHTLSASVRRNCVCLGLLLEFEIPFLSLFFFVPILKLNHCIFH